MPFRTVDDLLHFWRGDDPTAYPQDGIVAVLAADVPAGAGPDDLLVVSAANLPQGGAGEPAALAVVSQGNLLDVKEIVSGYTVSGTTLSGCVRLYGNRSLTAGDYVLCGWNSLNYQRMVDVLACLTPYTTSAGNPAAAGGTAAPVGTLCRDTTNGVTYVKTDTGATDWEAL